VPALNHRTVEAGSLQIAQVSRLRLLVAAVWLLGGPLAVHGEGAPDCAPLDAAMRTRALQIAARTMGTEPVLPVIDREALLEGTCYWQLFVTLPHKRGHGILYVSPDHRFVSPALWDMKADYGKEDAEINDRLRAQADADHPPTRGPEDAPVTVVEFSDSQCPFCAAFSRIVEQYQREHPGTVRIVFRNYPLPMHKWAKDAARAGICVAQQAPNAFWQLQDFLFAEQKEITVDNLEERIKGFLQTTTLEVSTEKYFECMAGHYPESRLNKDIDEAEAYHIHSTPTLFINGHRHGGFGSAEEFSDVVNASLKPEVNASLKPDLAK
jgi:protein-disulfide isomerase